MKLIYICFCVFLVGCAGFNCSIGVGYRKVPPEIPGPILQSPSLLKFSLTPAQIELIFSLLGSEAFEKLIQSALPQDNRVDFGGWCEISIKGESK